MLRSLRSLAVRCEPLRYLQVGALCAILSNAILIAGDATGLHYSLSLALVFVVVIPVSYLAHALWTFDVQLSWIAFGRFVLGSLSSFVVGSALVVTLRGGLMMPMLITAPLCTVAMMAYNYLIAKWSVARKVSVRVAQS